MHEIDLSNYNIRSDLIIENNDISHSEEIIDGITITRTKKDGNYITLSFDDITDYGNREIVGKNLDCGQCSYLTSGLHLTYKELFRFCRWPAR